MYAFEDHYAHRDGPEDVDGYVTLRKIYSNFGSTFDLFKFYYVIVDNYTREIQYISDEIYVADKYALTVEDRNNDGISELYINYFKDGKFTVDERGYNLRTTRCYDRIEWSPESKKIKPQQP